MRNLVLRIVLAVLALGGVVDSYLALKVHFEDPNAAPPCAVTENFDCGAVNHSKYAVFPPTMPAMSFGGAAPVADTGIHIPIAVIGIAGYALMLVLALAARWWILLQFAEIGFAAASFLTYIEAYVVQKWCIYCLVSHGIVTAIVLFTIVAIYLRHRDQRRLPAVKA